MDAEGRFIDGYAHGFGHLPADRFHRQLGADRELAPDELGGADEAERDVGVGHRRHRAALVVAHRPRHGARALRPGEERAPGVDANERAAPRSDLGDVDGRNAHVVAASLQEPRPEVDPRPDVEIRDPVVPAALDHRRLGRRPAHVEGEDVLVAELGRDLRRPDDPRRWPRLDDVDRPRRGRIDAHRPAVRLHDPQGTGDPEPAKDPLEGSEIGPDDRQDVRVHHRGAGSLVLLELRVDLARQAQRHVDAPLPDHLRDAPLVPVIGVAVDEGDGDGLHAVRKKPVERGVHARFVERLEDPAGMVDPLGDLHPVDPGRERLGFLPSEVVEAGHAKAPDLEDVAEAGGGDEAGPDAPLLEDRVRGDGRAVNDLLDLVAGNPDPRQRDLEALGDAAAVVVRGRRDLDGEGMAPRPQQDEIGEGATDVDSDAIAQSLPPDSTWPPRARRRLAFTGPECWSNCRPPANRPAGPDSAPERAGPPRRAGVRYETAAASAAATRQQEPGSRCGPTGSESRVSPRPSATGNGRRAAGISR